MPTLNPEETVKLSIECLRSSKPSNQLELETRWCAAAASAFHQAGVQEHRRLFVSEIIADFDAGSSPRDPRSAGREANLVMAVDENARAHVAWYYQTAIAYAPEFAEPIYNLAALRRNAGRFDDAFDLFMSAARAQPHSRARPHAHLRANHSGKRPQLRWLGIGLQKPRVCFDKR